MSFRFAGVRIVAQLVPAAVAGYWPLFGLATNAGTRGGSILPGCRYLELNAGRFLLTVIAAR